MAIAGPRKRVPGAARSPPPGRPRARTAPPAAAAAASPSSSRSARAIASIVDTRPGAGRARAAAPPAPARPAAAGCGKPAERVELAVHPARLRPRRVEDDELRGRRHGGDRRAARPRGTAATRRRATASPPDRRRRRARRSRCSAARGARAAPCSTTGGSLEVVAHDHDRASGSRRSGSARTDRARLLQQAARAPLGVSVHLPTAAEADVREEERVVGEREVQRARRCPSPVLFEAPPRIGLWPAVRASVHSLTLPVMSNAVAVALFAKQLAIEPVSLMSS